jgi:type I restriction enzyme, S subunit
MILMLTDKPQTSWDFARLKTAVRLKSIREGGNSSLDNYIGLENIESWTGRLISSSVESVQWEEETTTKSMVSNFDAGDVLFGKLRPYLAKAHLTKKSGVCTTELLVLEPNNNIDGKFLTHVLLTSEFINAVNAETFGVKMPRADWNTIGNLLIPLPPISQQREIAEYLDRETAKLDALIAANQRLLTLLAEKRRSLLTQAVTRGLKSRAHTKDSGIEWLGEIPEHWTLWRIKHLATVGNGSTPLKDYVHYWKDGSFPWLTSTVVNDDVIGKPTDFITEEALQECHLPIVKPNSILVAITGQGKTRGKASLLTYEATINQHLAFITPIETIITPSFLQCSLMSAYEVLRMISEGTGSTKGALTCEQLGDFLIPLPPISEQCEILAGLQENMKHTDLLSSTATKAINLLQERRTSLISAAVTGQIQIAT